MENYTLDDLSKLFDEKINSKMKILEKILEEKLNTNISMLDLNSQKKSASEITEEFIDQKIKAKLSLSIKYWYPTLITVILFTVGGVWWFYNQLNPLKEAILIQQNKTNPTLLLNEQKIVDRLIHLVDIKLNDSLSDFHQKTIRDIAHYLNNDRKDLVIIIAGYTKRSGLSREVKVENSELAAKKVADRFKQENIAVERVFYKGHGSNIPIQPPKIKDLNVCVIICDIYGLMTIYNQG